MELLEREKGDLQSAAETVRAELAEQQRQTKSLLEDLGRQRAESEALRQQVDQLQVQVAERDQRQRLLDEELLKAEAQIDLIKDVIIREKAF